MVILYDLKKCEAEACHGPTRYEGFLCHGRLHPPPEPKSEASPKQMYFANADWHAYRTMQDFVQYNTLKLPKTYETCASDVKVVPCD